MKLYYLCKIEKARRIRARGFSGRTRPGPVDPSVIDDSGNGLMFHDTLYYGGPVAEPPAGFAAVVLSVPEEEAERWEEPAFDEDDVLPVREFRISAPAANSHDIIDVIFGAETGEPEGPLDEH